MPATYQSIAPSRTRNCRFGPDPRPALDLSKPPPRLAIATPLHDAPALGSPPGLVGISTVIRLLRLEVSRFARLKAPVLVCGETGTGKELVARALHECSLRSGGPFVTVNCGGLAESLLEDIFFGHERGAFTGAGGLHRGVFERAHGGTLFLDEIGELPPIQQAALLRVLDDGRVWRLGSEREERVDVRVVAATNRDLLAMTGSGAFRLDLYHRLSALRIVTPPLRDRPDDVAPLSEHFLRALVTEMGPRRLDEEALDLLRAHPFPGNARELRNVLYRAAASTGAEVIGAGDLDLEQPPVPRTPPGRAFRLSQLTDASIREVLERFPGNISAASRELGVPRSTLRDRVARSVEPEAGAKI
jgi:DNA-binding NtrC family response regulator